MNELDHNQEKNQTAVDEKKNLRAIIVTLDDIVEYNRVKELSDYFWQKNTALTLMNEQVYKGSIIIFRPP